jgi:hypothetical protein
MYLIYEKNLKQLHITFQSHLKESEGLEKGILLEEEYEPLRYFEDSQVLYVKLFSFKALEKFRDVRFNLNNSYALKFIEMIKILVVLFEKIERIFFPLFYYLSHKIYLVVAFFILLLFVFDYFLESKQPTSSLSEKDLLKTLSHLTVEEQRSFYDGEEFYKKKLLSFDNINSFFFYYFPILFEDPNSKAYLFLPSTEAYFLTEQGERSLEKPLSICVINGIHHLPIRWHVYSLDSNVRLLMLPKKEDESAPYFYLLLNDSIAPTRLCDDFYKRI